MTTTSEIPTPAPGRLGDPTMDLASDPRSDPRMVAAFAPFGLDKGAQAPAGWVYFSARGAAGIYCGV